VSHDWTSRTANVGGSHLNDIATDGVGTWVAVGNSGKGTVSTDGGDTWTLITGTPFGTATMRGVAFGNGFWVAVGYTGAAGGVRLYTATDPAGTWTQRTISGISASVDRLTSVTYGNSIWVCCGGGESAGVYGLATTGSDPTTGWTQRTITDAAGHTQPDPNFAADMDVAFGDGRFVVVGGDDLVTSTDGTTWTNYGEIANGGADDGVLIVNMQCVTYGNGLWMVGGNPQSTVIGGSSTSGVVHNDDVTDMWGWTGVALTAGIPWDIEYGDVFMVISGDGTLFSSSTGTSGWANDNSTFFTATPFYPSEFTGGLAYGDGIWGAAGLDDDAGPIITSSAPYVLQTRNEETGALIASIGLSQLPDQMRRTPSGQHVFVKQGNDMLQRYDRVPALIDTVTIADFFPNDDWNPDNSFALYRLEGNVLYKYDRDGSLAASRDLNAEVGYRFPTKQIAGGTGQQLYAGRSSGNGGVSDGFLRVVGYIGGADWTAGSEACLLVIRRSDLSIEDVRTWTSDDGVAQATSVTRFDDCLDIGGHYEGSEFEGETGSTGNFLMRVPVGLTGGDGGSEGSGLEIGEDE
jgi:hypothetical protein